MFFQRKSKMCDSCRAVKTYKRFPSPDTYLSALESVKGLLAGGNYEMLFSSCPIEKVKDDNGYWFDDSIAHKIKCKQCGTVFICSCNTYHGIGSLERTKPSRADK